MVLDKNNSVQFMNESFNDMPKPYVHRMRGQKRAISSYSFFDIIWSGFGAFISIYSLYLFNQYLDINHIDQLVLISSFGASVVLIYGEPQGNYSQPRNVLGGHLISAFIGISVYYLMPNNIELASALTVSLSLIAMKLSFTVHPPGAGTGLLAIIGSHQIHHLGYQYLLYPVLSSLVFLLVIALIINNLSRNPQRHYPKYWF